EPGDAHRGMAENAGRHAGLLDIGVAIHDAADPPEIDVHGPDRATADHQAGRSAAVGHGGASLARVLHARVDDLDCGHHVLRGAQHVEQADAGALERLAEHEHELELHARHDVAFEGHFGAVLDDHVVVQHAV